MTELAPCLSAFLREHLPRQRNASRHTVASYADSFMLLIRFAADRLGIRPSAIAVEHLTAELIFAFLDHLETERQNKVSTRNVRLAAIKSFFRYLEYRVPSCLDLAQQVHAMPMKRHDVMVVPHLEREEIRALLDAPDPATAAGRRDRAMLHLAYAAGLRVSELIAVMLSDLRDTVHITGKGRRRRVLPLWKETRYRPYHWQGKTQARSAAVERNQNDHTGLVSGSPSVPQRSFVPQRTGWCDEPARLRSSSLRPCCDCGRDGSGDR